uniref:Chitin binding protein n=1 Tax=Debaryomyces robertsiae TaxID=28555 RepID=Q707V9_9ASCO|nr:chitin binding protein [Debaryomyces robertsiae]
MILRSLILLSNFLLVFSLAPRWSNETSFTPFALYSSNTCSYVKIKSGQTAYSACGSKVSAKDLEKFNPNTNINNLKIGQIICCTSGSMPNLKPSPNGDGSCKTYIVKSGDSCDSISSSYYPLSVKDIEQFNSKNYGWKGCSKLQKDYKLCLSSGTTPRPTPNPKAECGPLAPGDKYNSKCPLNACCSEFGFCGLTAEFCEKKSCFSNCGYGHLHTDTRGDFDNIVYWLDAEGPLASDPDNIGSDYSRVHYAFVNINSDFTIDDSNISNSYFLNIKNNKVASFGGWDFSTNPSTYKIFREGVKSQNRDKFTSNLVVFAQKYNLDGIDLDWEYPGAPDIPGIPADDKNNGKNYLEFIKLLKSKLPGGMSLSIAIPSSYWYLKNFPLKDIQQYLDYMVYMTYDIYGVWDMDKDSRIKCHTNKTAVIDALKMLDKAQIEIGKTYGGISNYGRSYKASSTSCMSENCPFSGPGNKRDITNTPGVLAESELNAIASSSAKNKRWTNNEIMCDFMIYDGDSVVGWPKPEQRNSMQDFFRTHWLKGSFFWVDNYFSHDEYYKNDTYVLYHGLPDDYWQNIMDEEADMLGDMTDFSVELSSNSKCNKDPSSINLDSETDPACLYLGMSYQLLQKGEGAIDYIRNINRNAYNSDHTEYVKVITNSLWSEFDDWIGFNLFKQNNGKSDGSGQKFYECLHNGNPVSDDEMGYCIIDAPCSNMACTVFGSSFRRISNLRIKEGMKSPAASSLSEFSGLTIEPKDFELNSKRKTVKQPGGQEIAYVNCEFVDFADTFPNPLGKLDSNYLDNMQNIVDKVSSDYKTDSIEALFISLTTLAALNDVSEPLKTVSEQAKKFRAEERKERILSIINFVFMGISIIAMPFGVAANLAIDTALLIASTVAELKLEGKISGDSLAFGLIAIIQPFVKLPSEPLSNIFKTINLSSVSKLNGKFKTNSKFEDIISAKIKTKYCKG